MRENRIRNKLQAQTLHKKASQKTLYAGEKRLLPNNSTLIIRVYML
jgi:hypothetical protein